MSKLLRKCRDDGYCPTSPTEVKCPICDLEFHYLCPDCKSWTKINSCTACRERVVYEDRLRTAKAYGDVYGALAAVQQLTARFPAKHEYQCQLISLQAAQTALAECGEIPHMSLDKWKNVKAALERLSRARATLLTASLAEPPQFGQLSNMLDQAAEGLSDVERIKKQAVVTIPLALAAAIALGALWSASHIAGSSLGYLRGGAAAASTYAWVLNVACSLGIAILIGLIARSSWGIPGIVVGLISVSVLVLTRLLSSAVGGYGTGLLLLMLVGAAVTWIFETGRDIPPRPDPLRAWLGNLVRNRVRPALSVGKGFAAFVVATLLFLGAPSIRRPGEALQPGYLNADAPPLAANLEARDAARTSFRATARTSIPEPPSP